MSIIAGIIFHGIGGVAASGFYLPFKKVKGWAWESYWLISGIAAWIIMPIIMAWIFIPEIFTILQQVSPYTFWFTFLLGMLWGIGGLTFGLSMRYLGISLGYAIVLGATAAFGTLIPPIADGSFTTLIITPQGRVLLAGVVLCLAGIGFCGFAGHLKDKQQKAKDTASPIRDFNFKKGLLVALFSGVLSASMAFALATGKPIASIALEYGSPVLWQNNAVLVVILWGGFISNFAWCIYLNIKNKTWGDYSQKKNPLSRNYLLSSLAGVIWYLQFFFYGMGSTQMGEFDFASWTLHMTFIILLSTIWGVLLREWQGVAKHSKIYLTTGIVLLISSVIVIGWVGMM